ncbi:uncharacterized protein PHALS_07195 [Plasmopara halstedii]|uniref:Uncharacterized protein n=1 Tax=Plasmopara halstedii TaxID=4781 RepID=A0A0P1B4V4_PLAHL|nr:uncharacterized protein PHALS_07195 [Plasmopara halstedii]CEG49431.1 hypothetical protein PHALS_07195 [Plasmopara halstedii]|eukprot:XP_024585800.1 hypothetical protein PHALS_07195 [Plasmopara halstedii]
MRSGLLMSMLTKSNLRKATTTSGTQTDSSASASTSTSGSSSSVFSLPPLTAEQTPLPMDVSATSSSIGTSHGPTDISELSAPSPPAPTVRIVNVTTDRGEEVEPILSKE